jgi:hypothetical protein
VSSVFFFPFHVLGIRIRLSSASECRWSDVFPLVISKAVTSLEEKVDYKQYKCSMRDNRTASFGLMLTEQANGALMTLTVAPQLEVFNYLPCDIQYKAAGMKEDITIVSGGNASAIFYQPDNKDQSSIHFFRLGYYTASIPLKFPKKNHSFEDNLEFYSSDRSKALGLRIKLVSTPQGLHHVIIYSTFLVVDRTGLCAVFSNVSSSGKDSKSAIDWNRRTFLDQKQEYDPINVHIPETLDNESWIMGKNGFTLFSPSTRKFNVSFLSNNGSVAVIPDIDVESVNAGKSNLDAPDEKGNRFYYISLKASPYPLAADLTSVLTVMPTFHIVNYMKTDLFVYQQDVSIKEASNAVKIAGKATAPYHGIGMAKRETSLYFKTAETEWSVGKITTFFFLLTFG